MKIRQGDTVVVISGKDKGKQGIVTRVLPLKHRVIVEGANMRVRHIKKTAQQAGSRISYEASLHVSNVMILDPKTKKPTRIGYKTDEKTGKKFRFAKASGEVIAGAAKAKQEKGKKKTMKTEKTEGTDVKEIAEEKMEKMEKDGKSEAAVQKKMGPAKQPFWKRAFTGAGPEDQALDGGRNRQEEIDKNSPASARRSRESN